MPVNFQEIQRQVKEMGRQAPQREKILRDKREQAQQLLQDCSGRLEELDQRVEQAVGLNSGLRCAVPVEENLTYTSLPQPIQGAVVLLAADGSQVNPSRHDPVEFGVINIGAIRIIPGQAEPPREITRSQLLYHDALYSNEGPLTEEIVALRRDLWNCSASQKRTKSSASLSRNICRHCVIWQGCMYLRVVTSISRARIWQCACWSWPRLRKKTSLWRASCGLWKV
jgi:hypothetical protein